MKYIIKIANNTKIIIFIYLISIIISSLSFSYIESRPLLDWLWWSCISALTIWYWDIAPITIYWKALWIFFWHFWIFFIMPMIIVNITSKVIDDKNKFTDEEQKELQENIKLILKNLEWKK